MGFYNNQPYKGKELFYKQDGYGSYNWNTKPELVYEEDNNGTNETLFYDIGMPYVEDTI